MKDMPTLVPAGLAIACHLPREDPRDALVAPRAASRVLPICRAARRSAPRRLRRKAQLLYARPDLRDRAAARQCRDAAREARRRAASPRRSLAVAGLKRLGRADRIAAVLAPEEMLPAVAQGVIAVETRAEDATRSAPGWRRSTMPPTPICAAAERALARGARRLVPHADRGAGDGSRANASPRCHGDPARRQSALYRARRDGARGDAAAPRRRRRRRAQSAGRRGFLRRPSRRRSNAHEGARHAAAAGCGEPRRGARGARHRAALGAAADHPADGGCGAAAAAAVARRAGRALHQRQRRARLCRRHRIAPAPRLRRRRRDRRGGARGGLSAGR